MIICLNNINSKPVDDISIPIPLLQRQFESIVKSELNCVCTRIVIIKFANIYCACVKLIYGTILAFLSRN